MRSGTLRHRIEIQGESVTRDSYGGETKSWTTSATVWASINPLSGRERLAAQQVNAETTHKITMRYHSGLTPENRIKFGSRIFDIEEILNTGENNVELVIMAREEV